MSSRVDAPPPTAPTAEKGGGGDWVQLIRARDDIDASLLAGRLSETGIESRLVKDAAAPTWMYGGRNPWGPVVVLVRRFQLDDARLVLAEVSLSAPAAEPRAAAAASGSRSVPIGWWVTAAVLGALLSAAALVDAVQSVVPCPLSLLC